MTKKYQIELEWAIGRIERREQGADITFTPHDQFAVLTAIAERLEALVEVAEAGLTKIAQNISILPFQ